MSTLYTARASSKDQVLAGLRAINFPRGGPWTGEDSNRVQLAINKVLLGAFHPSSGSGHSRLATNGSDMARLKSTDVATADSILKESREEAAEINKTKAKDADDVPPAIATRSEAHDEADRRNEATQAVLGAKEATAIAITEMCGDAITAPYLKTEDGTAKTIDEWQVSDLIAAIHNGAERQRAQVVVRMINQVVEFQFDNRRRYTDEMIRLRAIIARIYRYGIDLGDDIVANLLLANMEEAAKHGWGREISNVLDECRSKYAHNHRHDATSVSVILGLLNKADSIRALTAAPAPTAPTGFVRTGRQTLTAVENGTDRDLAQSVFTKLIFDDSSDEENEMGTANAAGGYDSESSTDTNLKSRSSRSTTTKKPGARKNGRKGKPRDEMDRSKHTAENNPCKHCRKNGRIFRHTGTPPEECFWNPKWKGFRPRYVCTKLNKKYKARGKFPEHLGGYASDGGETETSDEE